MKAVIENEGKEFRLTQYTHGLGCACKIEPRKLEQILKHIPILPNPDILVGVETSDDAAVFKITDDIAIVQTLDFLLLLSMILMILELLQQQMP